MNLPEALNPKCSCGHSLKGHDEADGYCTAHRYGISCDCTSFETKDTVSQANVISQSAKNFAKREGNSLTENGDPNPVSLVKPKSVYLPAQSTTLAGGFDSEVNQSLPKQNHMKSSFPINAQGISTKCSCSDPMCYECWPEGYDIQGHPNQKPGHGPNAPLTTSSLSQQSSTSQKLAQSATSGEFAITGPGFYRAVSGRQVKIEQWRTADGQWQSQANVYTPEGFVIEGSGFDNLVAPWTDPIKVAELTPISTSGNQGYVTSTVTTKNTPSDVTPHCNCRMTAFGIVHEPGCANGVNK